MNYEPKRNRQTVHYIGYHNGIAYIHSIKELEGWWIMSDEVFEIGEKVVIDSNFNGKEIVEVIRKTPTGRIVVSRNNGSTVTFNANGMSMGNDKWHYSMLRKSTPKILDEIELLKLRIHINKTPWSKVSLETMRKIVDALKADEGEQSK